YSLRINPGLGFAASPGMSFLKKMLERYESMHFIDSDGRLNLTTIVSNTTVELEKYGLEAVGSIQQCCGFTIYSPDYFSPKDMTSRKIYITDNTYTIHHFDSSWHTPYERFKRRIMSMIGPNATKTFVTLKRSITK
ncbi:MAG: glycosyl transferase, partial [Lachnospiraceae bacterium]|nr:glycosyl transferase [Lachnospiraceae bacterium]